MPFKGNSAQADVKAQLKNFLKDTMVSLESASEDQQRRLLSALQELKADDRRKHPRKPCSIPATAAITRCFTGYIRDMSGGGAFLETTAAFEPGEHVTLTFASPNENKPIRVTGRVVRRTSQGIGVQFTMPPTKELQATIEFL